MLRTFLGVPLIAAVYLLGTAPAFAFLCSVELQFVNNCDPVAVPEPSSIALLLAGLGGLAALKFRKKR